MFASLKYILFLCVKIRNQHMNRIEKDFDLFARDRGISSNKLNGYKRYQDKIYEPYILEERQLNVTSMSIFSRLMYDRILFLSSEVDEDSANILNAQILYLNSTESDDISLFMNTPGGSVIDGLAIYDVMNFVSCDIQTYCIGMCASMGSVLLSSGAKGKRHSLPHGSIMIHQPSTAIGRIKSTDLMIEAEEMKKCEATLYSILSQNTGQDIDHIRELCQHDKWYTAKEAVAFGLIDDIVSKTR